MLLISIINFIIQQEELHSNPDWAKSAIVEIVVGTRKDCEEFLHQISEKSFLPFPGEKPVCRNFIISPIIKLYDLLLSLPVIQTQTRP